MLELPAVCNSCGAVFGSGTFVRQVDGILVAGDTAVRDTAGPCPRCGSKGRILEKANENLTSAVGILLAPGRTAKDIQQVISVLQEIAASQELDRAEVATAIDERLPKFARLGHLLPQNRSELYALLGLLIALATLLVDLYSQLKSKQLGPTEITRIVEQVIRELEKEPDEQRPRSAPPSSRSQTDALIADVRRWCYTRRGQSPDQSRFDHPIRAVGEPMSDVVRMKGGEPVTVLLPVGFLATVWDGNRLRTIMGPKHISGVIEMTVSQKHFILPFTIDPQDDSESQ
jgi:hypothetical protein